MAADPNFEATVTKMKTQLGDIGKGLRNDGPQRPWLDLDTAAGKFDFEAFHKLLNRDKANEDYIKARSNKTAVAKDVQLPKISADFLAGMERDLRMRHRSRIRMFVHASARVSANGQDNGPLRRNTVDWLTAIEKEKSDKAPK